VCASLSSRTVFATSATFNGNFGGLAGADAACQTAASNANLLGSYKAWLSDGTSSPATRFFHSNVPYLLVNSTQVAPNWAGLIDGTLDAPINVDENGASQAFFAWTGTLANGTSSPDNCNAWTASSNGIHTEFGNTGASNSDWTIINGNAGCGNLFPLYCFQQQ
jgi:hypothetical protein